MPKKYDYFIVLTTNIGVHQVSVNLYKSFDHPIDSNDIARIENAAKSCHVINWKLLKVTGTFTYRVTYEVRESLCTPINSSRLCTLDHKVTTRTYDEDMMSFIDQWHKYLSGRQHPHILSFQEIPDE